MRVVYCGDGPIQGPASYLYCVLTRLGHQVDHVLPDESLKISLLKKKTSCLVLSDYSYDRVRSVAGDVAKLVTEDGMGLLMVGGWGSYQGGGYSKTKIEDLLPVTVKRGDDRLNYSPGLRMFPDHNSEILKGLPFDKGPMICGLNKVSVKPGAQTVLRADEIRFSNNKKIGLGNRSYPLFVVQRTGQGRAAAFMTDFAPHWAGGLLDWGTSRQRISIPKKKIAVEVGNAYIRFIGNLINWLTQNKYDHRTYR